MAISALDSPPTTLPDCLLLRILSLLPMDCLFRLRCVCKEWRSLPFSLLFSDSVAAISPQRQHSYILLFRLLVRVGRDYHSDVAFDRELLGSSGFSLDDDGNLQEESYRVLGLASRLVSSLAAGDLEAQLGWRLLQTEDAYREEDLIDRNVMGFINSKSVGNELGCLCWRNYGEVTSIDGLTDHQREVADGAGYERM